MRKLSWQSEDEKKDKKLPQNPEADRLRTLQIDSVVWPSQLIWQLNKKKAFQAQNRIKQPAIESGYTTTIAYIHSQFQHTSFFFFFTSKRAKEESASGLEGGFMWVCILIS